MRKTEERSYEAELYRLQGELMLRSEEKHQVSAATKRAEEYFLQAIAVAQDQTAKAWELRAVMSLSRLWQQQGKNEDAWRMLTEIYNWFSEGFDTKE